MEKSIPKISFCVFFILILSFFSCSNFGMFVKIFQDKEFSCENFSNEIQNVEEISKENFQYKNNLIDLYGMSLILLNKNVVGNFEFVRDSIGIMQRFETVPSSEKFVNNLLNLKNVLDEKGIPLIYVQMPDRTRNLSLASESSGFTFYMQRNEHMLNEIQENGIEILDFDKLIDFDPTAPDYSEYFFHTDVHLSTQAEFWMFQFLSDYLTTNHGIIFNNLDQASSQDDYEISEYKFLGNLSRLSGRFFTESDCFENYIPIFETNLQLVDKYGNIKRTGNFQSVVMNGHEYESNIDMYTYWITNYGNYPEPYYQYQNQMNTNGPKILIISDSILLRCISFFSLISENVTVIEPRFLEGISYLEWALSENDYDAVIVGAASYSFFTSEFSARTLLPDLPEKNIQTADYWIGTNGLCLDTCNDMDVESDIIEVRPEDKLIELYGWSADFNSLQPLDSLYLQVGDHIIQCEYGIKRTSVSDHYQNSDLTNTGFSATFPISYLKNGEVKEISFIQISSDGQHCYEPIPFEVTFIS